MVDALNNGLTRILKDIANTYDNVDFKDLSEKYLIRQSTKRPKRQGHVSAYNIFVKETRPSIAEKNPNLSFSEIAAHLSQRWQEAKRDKKRMAELHRKTQEYTQAKNRGEEVQEAPEEPVKKSTKKRNKKQRA